MKKLTAADPETKSPDLVAENVERMKALFPEAFTEGKVNFDVLKQLLGGKVDEREEKYGLNWHGKRRARQLALTPSTGTLRPCPEESVDWDTTQNLMIEGDNLEVLKLLQKSYAGKVKMIYIDPPYNTGSDFVYPDDFADNIANYQTLMGWRTVDGEKVTSLADRTNPENSGRFHTNWLNMIYPRLRVARSLLRADGVIFVSIDEAEVSRLLLVLDEVFGAENFESIMTWRRRHNQPNDKSKMIAKVSEHIVCYAKRSEALQMAQTYYGVPLSAERITEYTNIDGDKMGKWSSNPWKSAVGRGGSKYIITTPTGRQFDEIWYGNEASFAGFLKKRKVHWTDGGNGLPRIKVYLEEAMKSGQPAINFLRHENYGTNSEASSEVEALMQAEGVFDNPKPTRLLRSLAQIGTADSDIVLDFFGGSGTTGHAIMAQNIIDGGNRRYIVVQLPEPLDPKNNDQKTAADFCDKLKKPCNIAELTKERLRRAGKKLREDTPMFAGDLGFRVFKLDSSNIRAWEPDRDDLSKTVEDSVEHLVSDRTEQDILFELLLKLGLDLTVPIQETEVRRQETRGRPHRVYSVGGGVLIVCLSVSIAREDVEPLALGIVEWHKALAPAGETTVVFRDSAFADDVAKTNLTAILQQHGMENVRSL